MSRLNIRNNRFFMNFFKDNINLIDVKFPIIDFHKFLWFYRMFYGCKKIQYIDISSVYNDNGEYFYDMFRGCKSLEVLYLPDFNKGCLTCSKDNMFLDVPKNATIVINKNFYNSVKDQLTDFINVYDI